MHIDFYTGKMMGSVLLLLLGALACPWLCHCRPFFFLAAPNVLRAGTEETIVIQAHEYNQDIDIHVSVYNFPIKINAIWNASTTLTAPHYIKTLIIKIPFENVKPKFSTEKQYVTVEAKSTSVPGLVLHKTILLSQNTGYIYIQTDKSIYTPAQTVHYRIFVTNQKLDPTTRNVNLEIQNPSGVPVIHESWHVESGLISTSLQIPELAGFGNWKIVATFNENPERKYVAEFEVKEYVLPSFEVHLTSNKKYFHVNNKEITININARYLHNEEVHGHALAIFGIIHESKKTHLPNSWKRVDIDGGEGTVTLTKKHLEDAFGNTTELLGASIFVNVTVVSSGGDVVHAEKSGIKIVDSPYRIRFIKTSSYFKPGIPFQITVIVTNPDESPAAGVEVIADPGQQIVLTDNEGVATLGVNSASDSKRMSIKVTTNDGSPHVSHQATTSLEVTAYTTVHNSGNFLHINVANVAQAVSLNLHTKYADSNIRKNIKYITVLLFAKGTIFKVIRQELVGGDITALRIEKTPEMWPSFRIVAYYYLTQGLLTEIVSDSAWVDMPEDYCMGTLELKKKDPTVNQYSPGSAVNLQLIADRGARVGLVAVDKAVYALNKKSKLSQKKIKETVEKNDFGCTHGSGKNNLKVFEDAGLDFVTNVGIATTARTELNCPQPPSRKRRAIKNVEKKRTKENEYSGEARDCCRAGFRENPMGFTCEQRKAYIRLSESCVKAFVDCCKFAEALQPEQREKLIWSRADDQDDDEEELDEENGESVMIRSYFPESWLWRIYEINDLPNKPTDESVLTVPFFGHLPDSITTWEMVAVSIRKDKGICVSKPLELMVKKKFFVDLKLPYSVVRNEQVEIKAVLYNHNDDSMKVTVKFQYDESLCSVATRRKGYSVKVNVPKYSSVAVPYVVIPLVLGKIMIKVEARQQDISDGIQKPLNVVAEGQLIRLSRSILLNPQGKLQLETILRGRFDDLVPNTEPGNFISIQGDIMGESLLGSLDSSALESMIILPSGCPEQHLFSTTPNVILTKYLDDTRQWDLIGVERRNKVIRHIVDGLNKQMMTFRLDDNSFQHGTWLTAYIVKIFAFAYELVTVDRSSLCKSVTWLTQKQNKDGSFVESGKVYTAPMKGGFPGSEAEQSLTAFVLISLNQTKEICKEIVQDLETRIQRATKYLEGRLLSLKTTYSAVITSYALALVDSPQANDVIDNFGENKAYWPYEKDPNSLYTVETTAYALLHKIKQEKYHDTHRIAEWLIGRRNIGGGYLSTQPTAVALQALAEYKKLAQHRDDMQLNVTLEIFGRAEPKVWIINSVQRYQQRSEKVLANKEIKITATGSGKGTITVITVYQSIPNEQNKLCKAFMLSASLESVDKDVKEGFLATYKLTIRARYLGERDAPMSIIDIKMLTSFIPEENDLKQLTNTVENYISQYEPQTTVNNGSVIIYLDEVSRTNDTILSFKVYQSLEATMLQPAAVTIYEYYDPDKRCDTYYNIPNEAEHLRKLCQGSACKCAEEKCAKQKDLDDGITTEELNDAACEVGVDYVYRVRLTKTDQFDSDMYDRHNMSIVDIIKSGTEQMKAGSARTFFSHLTCREKLMLEVNKQYLIMGLHSDMWEVEKRWAYLLGGKSYVIWWPEGEQSKTDEIDILEEFATSFKKDGCQT